MQKIVVASGKGGVGKTMLASSLASLLSEEKKLVLVDADVDCPNLSILFEGKKTFEKKLSLSKKAKIDEKKCTKCGLCEKKCVFEAIKNLKVNPFLCEGCGLCKQICPAGAISLYETKTGTLRETKTEKGFPLAYAQLEPGESVSGKLVYETRKLGEKQEKDLALIDSAAGIGCPVIASLTNTDLVIGVAEPTRLSLSDLKRLFEVADHFGIPKLIVLNKKGLPGGNEEKILRYAEETGTIMLGEIPYDEKIPELLADKKTPIESDTPAKKNLEEIGKRLLLLIKRRENK